jgi:hypothetical protein
MARMRMRLDEDWEASKEVKLYFPLAMYGYTYRKRWVDEKFCNKWHISHGSICTILEPQQCPFCGSKLEPPGEDESIDLEVDTDFIAYAKLTEHVHELHKQGEEMIKSIDAKYFSDVSDWTDPNLGAVIKRLEMYKSTNILVTDVSVKEFMKLEGAERINDDLYRITYKRKRMLFTACTPQKGRWIVVTRMPDTWLGEEDA